MGGSEIAVRVRNHSTSTELACGSEPSVRDESRI
jgi:hypothetical protein